MFNHRQAIAFDLVKHLHRARAFSGLTFGPGARTKGVVDHIRKELVEIEQSPYDLEEWIDVAILAFDGAWRSGHTPEEIAAALVTKQDKNEHRQRPDWRTADPNAAIEHVRNDRVDIGGGPTIHFGVDYARDADLTAGLVIGVKGAVAGEIFLDGVRYARADKMPPAAVAPVEIICTTELEQVRRPFSW